MDADRWDRLRRGVSPEAASLVASASGLLAGVFAFLVGSLLLVNLHGPFGEHRGLGLLASVGLAVTVGSVLGPVFRGLARRSAAVLAVAVLATAVAVVVALPARIDVHESFVPQPNQRSSCAGWEFEHYPPGVMDGSATTYCIGLESSLSAG